MLHGKHLGDFGELLSIEFLVKRGFRILDINFRKRFCELDLIAIKGDKIHFIEVKTVSCESNVIHETFYRPEYNVSREKLRKMMRCIGIYLTNIHKNRENDVIHETNWQIDVISVIVTKKGININFIQNVIHET